MLISFLSAHTLIYTCIYMNTYILNIVNKMFHRVLELYSRVCSAYMSPRYNPQDNQNKLQSHNDQNNMVLA